MTGDPHTQWRAALPPHVAAATTITPAITPALTAALQHHTPADLARICATGIGRNASRDVIRRLVAWRIRREAGQLDDETEG